MRAGRLRATATRVVGGTPRRELLLVAGAMAVSLAVVLAYLLATRSHGLVGDEREYNSEALFFTMGKPWWSTSPFGIAHASMWKAPLYPAWVGLLYGILGHSPLRIELVQSLLAPLTVALTWLLARRLFGPRVALAAAWVTALFPLAFEYYGLLFPEALAVPATMAVVLLFLGRDPTWRRAAVVGAALGALLLLRPSSSFLLAGIAAAWIVGAGPRRGILMTALTIAVAALVVLPWTIRNFVVTDGGFVPISIQDVAAYGTFNAASANDPELPYAWRAVTPATSRLVERRRPLGDAEFRSRLQDLAFDYVKRHPASVPEAFYWNGLTRFWDVRNPSHSLDEVAYQGRSRLVRGLGLGAYYLLLPLTVVGLWRLRRRRALVIPLVALAAAASVVFTVDATTRYRAPLEPLIVTLACSLLAPARLPEPDRRSPAVTAPPRPEALRARALPRTAPRRPSRA